MDLMAAIGLLSSIVTLEEAGRSWVLIVKDKVKRKKIDINNWDSNDPLVQSSLDRFKTDMGDKYKDHIFSEEEIQEIIRGFFEQNRELRIGYEEKKQMTQIIEDILYAYNEHTKSLMSSGERTLHNTLSSDFSKIMDKLGVIEEQPRKENIKKFLRAIEISKEIELENIEELINGEYEIDRSEIIETIQAGREKLVSIQGNAGSGKSVVCKKLLKGKEYVLVTRAENLSTGKKVNELWDCDVEDAILWLENKPLYIFIDAIEFIADCGDNAFTLLQEIYRFADKYSNVLPKIAETIMDNINGNGIVKGKIGAAIWYYEYANYSSESKWTYIADNLLESVLADIVSADLGSDFNEGLSGIGWGLMYMRERKLTKININEAIEFIHNKDNSLSSEDMPLSLNMVFEITPFIPRNPKRWDYSMNGVLGTSLHIMEIYRMLGNNTLF